MRRWISKTLKTNVTVASAYYVFDGWRRRSRQRRGVLSTSSGSRHAALNLDASLDYIERVYNDYLSYAGRPALTGRVIEIGPGDNFGVALLCLKNGASTITAIDKYRSNRNPDQQAAIYAALSSRFDLAALFDGPPAEGTIRNFTYLPGMPAERFFTPQTPPYDAVISRAVLEHLDDPLLALDGMWERLQAGGMLVHRIDFRDHGMFAGAHPLSFLTISRTVYRLMTRDTGRPNRVLLPAYRDHLIQRQWQSRIGITRLVGVEGEFPACRWEDLPAPARDQALRAVAAIRPKLAAPFRSYRDEDLAVAGIVLVAEKP